MRLYLLAASMLMSVLWLGGAAAIAQPGGMNAPGSPNIPPVSSPDRNLAPPAQSFRSGPCTDPNQIGCNNTQGQPSDSHKRSKKQTSH